MTNRTHFWGFHGGSDSKESACNSGDPGSIPGSGRSPGEGNCCPLHYSCLENSIFKTMNSFIGWAAPWNSYDYPHHGIKPLRGPKGTRLCSYWGRQGWTWPPFSLLLTCCSVDSTVVVSSYLMTVACAAMMKPITQEPGSLLASPAHCGLADRCRALSCLLSQIGWVWILWRWQGALSKNCPRLISSPTWPVAFSLSLYPGYLSFPAGHETSQRQGKSSWWSGHNPPRGGQGEEFTTTLTLRFGRQMTSVSYSSLMRLQLGGSRGINSSRRGNKQLVQEPCRALG